MATLNIIRLRHHALPYQFPKLGTTKPLHQLSVKTITTSVRRALRRIFNNVIVSCTAQFINNRWIGTCIINGRSYQWIVY